ncbi:hypothetical protein K469DRAFT_545346, partial [Zopfia rhizophila CBS 207.26]
MPRDIIVCSLSTISLQSVQRRKNSYHALSYCWGSSKDQHVIICDNCFVLVRKNLYDALAQLSTQNHPAIWVDSLCINQDDNEEKSHQVGLMGEIYKTAEQVILWL